MTSRPASDRSILEVDWPFFGELCRALALKVAKSYQPDLVVGIAKAGVIPGAVVASIFQCDFVSMVVTRQTKHGTPKLLAGPPEMVSGRKVLIVDETCDSGDTLKVALPAVRALRPESVRTAVSFRTGPYQPDFSALEMESLIILPWDRVVIEDGTLVARPDYQRWLADT